MSEPCTGAWVVGTCGCGTCWDGHSPATQARAQALAAGFMWAATGRRYGPCEVTVQPCNPQPAAPLYRTFPVRGGGYDVWAGPTQASAITAASSGGGCGGGCRCTAACQVPLPGPVHSIVEVTIDGVAVDPSEMEIHDQHLLIRVGGECWPTCTVPGLEVPGFEVTYLRGLPIPPAVQYGFETLACEYAKACSGGACALPPRLASLSRQGIDITIAEVDATPGTLRTGVRVVDDAIDADNPYGLPAAPQVLSPDYPAPVTTVTWMGGS